MLHKISSRTSFYVSRASDSWNPPSRDFESLIRPYGIRCCLFYPVSHTATPVNNLGVHKKLRWNTAGTADPNGPKGYSTPCGTVFSLKKLGGNKNEAEPFGVTIFVFLSHFYEGRNPLSGDG